MTARKLTQRFNGTDNYSMLLFLNPKSNILSPLLDLKIAEFLENNCYNIFLKTFQLWSNIITRPEFFVDAKTIYHVMDILFKY